MKTKNINIDLIKLFLTRKKWILADCKYKGLERYVFNDDQELYILLPKDKSVPGAVNYINDAIRILSYFEDRTEDIVRRAVLAYDYDMHNYRVKDYVDHIPLTFFNNIIESSGHAIKRAAKIESKLMKDAAKNKDKELVVKELDAFERNCRFPHTWHGSFGITIETPLLLGSIGFSEDVPETLGRRTTNRIIKGFQIISESVIQNSHDYILDNMDDDADILIFEKFPEMTDDLRNNSIDISFELSPSIKTDPSLSNICTTTIDNRSLRNIKRSVESIKTVDDEKIDVVVFGFPETISATRSDLISCFEEDLGKVIIKGSSPKTGILSIQLRLDFDNYKKAVQAHEQTKNVRVHCSLKKLSRGWEVITLHSFDIAE